MVRELVFDTETTGLRATQHRIVNLAAVELVDYKPTGLFFHFYLNPERESDPHALAIHGLTTEFLADKPKFKDIAASWLDFWAGDPLVIHNAPFDCDFHVKEFARIGRAMPQARIHCTLNRARSLFGSGNNKLDQLVAKFGIRNLRADTGLHGALIDCLLLVNVYQHLRGVAVTPLTDEFLKQYGIGNDAQQKTTGQGAASAAQGATSADLSRAIGGRNGEVSVGDSALPNAAANGVTDGKFPAQGAASGDSRGQGLVNVGA